MDKIYEITVFRYWAEATQKYGLQEKQNKQYELAAVHTVSYTHLTLPTTGS